MGAFKKLEGRYLYVDMSKIHVPSWKIYEVTKAAQAKQRLLKKIDPFARCMGRKRKFETPEQLKKACDEYFAAQECYIYDKWGQPIKDPLTGEYVKSTHPLTISGLALHIGVATSTLRRYKAIAESGTVPYEFAIVVMEALQKIEAYAERRGYDKDGQRGSQFVLQAGFHWNTDKEERESRRLSIESKIAQEKLKMAKEEHELKMQLLKAGLDGGDDNDINITITRAKRKDEE